MRDVDAVAREKVMAAGALAAAALASPCDILSLGLALFPTISGLASGGGGTLAPQVESAGYTAVSEAR